MWDDLRPWPGVRLCEERIRGSEVLIVDGLPVTIHARSVAFLMRYADDPRQAACAFAMAAFDDLVSRREVDDYLGLAPRQGLSGWIGIPQARRAMHLADENCWSPREVSMMLTWRLDAGLPPPLMNQPVFDLGGRHIGTPDLLDVEAGVVGEYDGAVHLDGRQRAADIRREEGYRDLGLECFTVTADARPGETVARMLAARRRARWVPASARRWTVEPPSWWISTVTVAERRALTSAQRAYLLRHRRSA